MKNNKVLIGLILILISIILFSCVRDESKVELDLAEVMQKSTELKSADISLEMQVSEGTEKYSASTRTILIEENGIYQGYVATYESNVLQEELYIYENLVYKDYGIEKFDLTDFDYNELPYDLDMNNYYSEFKASKSSNDKIMYRFNKYNLDYSDFFDDYYMSNIKINMNIKIIIDSLTEMLDSINITISYRYAGVYYEVVIIMKINAYGEEVILNIPQSVKNSILEYIETQAEIERYVAAPSFYTSAGTYSDYVNVYFDYSYDSTIYYTLDGSTPTNQSSRYNYELVLYESAVVSIVAYKNGHYSEVVTREFVVKPKLSDLQFSKWGGTYFESIEVEITSVEGGNIYYTLDGSTPTINSYLYTGPIKIDKNLDLTAIAIKDGYIDSYIITCNYQIRKNPNPEVIYISTIEDLIAINNNLAGNYELINDIDISNIEWTPIGTEKNPFTGKFEGNGYKISGLKISNPSVPNCGLFGVVDSVTIINLQLEDININIDKSSDCFVGGLIGNVKGSMNSITNITVIGSIIVIARSSYNANVGGIIGYVNAPVALENINNYVNLSSYGSVAYAGGVIGKNMSTITIYDSNNFGNITANDSYDASAGGMVGYSSISNIVNCYNNGIISGRYSSGGIIGDSRSSATIELGSNEGQIDSYYNSSGGIIGYIRSTATISKCYNIGTINSGNYKGGLVGCINMASLIIKESYNTENLAGSVTGTYVGGLVGYLLGGVNIEKSYNTALVTGTSKAGGLIGFESGSNGAVIIIKESFNTGNVTIIGTSESHAGGLVGSANYISAIEIENCYNSGNITGNDGVGGILGGTSSVPLIIKNCLNFGNILQQNGQGNNLTSVGGLVGYATANTLIENCVTYGSITGNNIKSTISNVFYGGETIATIYRNNYYYNLNISNKNNAMQLINLNDTQFYLNDMNFDSDIWNFDDLDIANGKCPIIINNKNYL